MKATSLALLAVTSCQGEIILAEEVPTTCLLSPPRDSPEIYLFTFWTQSPDSEALTVLSDRVSEMGGLFSQISLRSRVELFAAIEKKNPEVDPPEDEVYQVNGGSDVLQFALQGTGTRVCSLEPLYEKYSLRERYFEAAWKPSECRGEPLALPLSVHRVNTVLLNVTLYEALQALGAARGRAVPDFSDLRSAEELVQVLEFAQAEGFSSHDDQPVVPLALCFGRDPGATWPLHHVAFESILASYGDQSYEAIWQGSEGHTREMKLDATKRLSEHLRRFGQVSNLNPAYDADCSDQNGAVSWQGAPRMVIAGEALLTIGGDWMRGLVPEGQRQVIKSYAFPSETEAFVYTPDSFAIAPRQQSDGSSAHAWYSKVVNHKPTQIAFSRLKQSIPALSQLSSQEVGALNSEYLEQAYNRFRDCHDEASPCRLLLAVSGLGPALGVDPCVDAVGMLLATIAGVQYEAGDWERRDCQEPAPVDGHQAEIQLADVLLRVSETPYAEECR